MHAPTLRHCYATEQIVTPLVPVQLSPSEPTIWCKLEYHNPSGSTKDRIARFILGKSVRSGQLRAGSEVVEASSGSTSISLALMAAQFDLRFLAVMPETVSSERIKMIKAFGAEVRLTPAAEGVAGAIAEAARHTEERGAFATDQFANPDNPAAHRHQTAAEIIAQVPARTVDVVVSGVGTGGTLVGLYQGFCDFGCRPVPVVARPTHGTGAYEAECSSFSARIPGVVDCLSTIFREADLADRVAIDIDDEEALETARRLIRHGFPVGPSSGLNFAAATRAARELRPDGVVVTVFPDRMERYFSTPLFD
ncbi:PLP-dependent cysteine synthase family protein [Botrimarina hoheduenensis]|uniref:Cysteine synthase n=1 Tax=Botrimarina hoheduenensis TaxID=2528000 RepID=A0A5C5VPL8_9BACT|nr:cysteine synthase family protein [Botrimarina hoheduenensis]TWT40087.1 Cysteine synthase [Botrimarina hoheduenensis]